MDRRGFIRPDVERLIGTGREACPDVFCCVVSTLPVVPLPVKSRLAGRSASEWTPKSLTLLGFRFGSLLNEAGGDLSMFDASYDLCGPLWVGLEGDEGCCFGSAACSPPVDVLPVEPRVTAC